MWREVGTIVKNRVPSEIRLWMLSLLIPVLRASQEMTRIMNRYGKKKDGSAQNSPVDRVFSNFELGFAATQMEALQAHYKAGKDIIEKAIKSLPEGRMLLDVVPAIGPMFVAHLLAYVDIHEADTVSKMWSLFGLCPDEVQLYEANKGKEGGWKASGQRGRADRVHSKFRKPFNQNCRNQAFVSSECLTKHHWRAVPVTREEWESLDKVYQSSKKVKDPETGKMVELPARTTPVSELGKMMLDYKFRKSHSEALVFHVPGKNIPGKMVAWKDVGAARIHAATLRYGIKQAMIPIHKAWREYHGLPVRPSFHEERLGHKHGGQ